MNTNFRHTPPPRPLCNEYCRTWNVSDMTHLQIWAVGNSRSGKFHGFVDSGRVPGLSKDGFGLKIGQLFKKITSVFITLSQGDYSCVLNIRESAKFTNISCSTYSILFLTRQAVEPETPLVLFDTIITTFILISALCTYTIAETDRAPWELSNNISNWKSDNFWSRYCCNPQLA